MTAMTQHAGSHFKMKGCRPPWFHIAMQAASSPNPSFFLQWKTLIHCIRPFQIYRQGPVPKTCRRKSSESYPKVGGFRHHSMHGLNFWGSIGPGNHVHLGSPKLLFPVVGASATSAKVRPVLGKGMKLEAGNGQERQIACGFSKTVDENCGDKGHQLHLMLASVDQFWMETS